VATVQNTDQWAKAAVMVRQSLTPNSPHAMMAVSSQNGLVFQRRLTASAVSFSTTGVSKPAPYWVRVVRNGNTLTGYQSSDGNTWVRVDSVSISLTGRVYIGLALTAHNNTALNTSTFDNVSVTTP
jgi:regulation of enolase protein 1 (concanavalin A-like superfamily)